VAGQLPATSIGGFTPKLTRLETSCRRAARAVRLVTAVALQVTAIWADRRYLDMTLLKLKKGIKAKAA